MHDGLKMHKERHPKKHANAHMHTQTHAHCLDEKKAPHNLKTNDGLAVSFLETKVYYFDIIINFYYVLSIKEMHQTKEKKRTRTRIKQ